MALDEALAVLLSRHQVVSHGRHSIPKIVSHEVFQRTLIVVVGRHFRVLLTDLIRTKKEQRKGQSLPKKSPQKAKNYNTFQHFLIVTKISESFVIQQSFVLLKRLGWNCVKSERGMCLLKESHALILNFVKQPEAKECACDIAISMLSNSTC